MSTKHTVAVILFESLASLAGMKQTCKIETEIQCSI